MPDVKSASTVSTSPEKRAATSPGFCVTSVFAGSLISFSDISERSAWVIFCPKSTIRLSCKEENIPSAARLIKYISTARKVMDVPWVRLSIMRASSSGGISDAATEPATHISVPAASSRCDRTADFSA